MYITRPLHCHRCPIPPLRNSRTFHTVQSNSQKSKQMTTMMMKMMMMKLLQRPPLVRQVPSLCISQNHCKRMVQIVLPRLVKLAVYVQLDTKLGNTLSKERLFVFFFVHLAKTFDFKLKNKKNDTTVKVFLSSNIYTNGTFSLCLNSRQSTYYI